MEIDYHFLSNSEFKKKIENNEFIEFEEVYGGVHYGTLKSEVENIWANNEIALFDIDVVGGFNIKKMYPIIHYLFLLCHQVLIL